MTHDETLIRMSTEGIPITEQFAWWRETINDVYIGIEPEISGAPAFQSSFEALALGDSKIGRIIAPGHRARRHAAAMRRWPDDSLFINFCESSDYLAEDHLGIGVVPRRTPRLHDNAQGFSVGFPEGHRMALISLRLPRDRFGVQPAFATLNAALAGTSLGQLIGEQFQLLSRAMDLSQPGVAIALGRSLEKLVLILAEMGGQAIAGAMKPETCLDHLKHYARTRLADSGLAITAIADAFHCTDRTIQSRFHEANETFSSWLLEERLLKAHSMLLMPNHVLRSVEWIAYGCGFASAAHFHRTFKARFGVTPGGLRTPTPLPTKRA